MIDTGDHNKPDYITLLRSTLEELKVLLDIMSAVVLAIM